MIVEQEREAYPLAAIRGGIEALEAAARADAAAAVVLLLHERFGELLLMQHCTDVLRSFEDFAALRDAASQRNQADSVASARGRVDAETARRIARHAERERAEFVAKRRTLARAESDRAAALDAATHSSSSPPEATGTVAPSSQAREEKLLRAARRLAEARKGAAARLGDAPLGAGVAA
jgi:hypothetical protein